MLAFTCQFFINPNLGASQSIASFGKAGTMLGIFFVVKITETRTDLWDSVGQQILPDLGFLD